MGTVRAQCAPRFAGRPALRDGGNLGWATQRTPPPLMWCTLRTGGAEDWGCRCAGVRGDGAYLASRPLDLLPRCLACAAQERVEPCQTPDAGEHHEAEHQQTGAHVA